MKEIYKDIPGYEGLYQVSNLGNVKRLESRRGRGKGYLVPEHLIKHSVNSRGYCNVVLCKEGKTKTFSLHRLVGMVFIDNPNNLPEIDHIDRNKENNCVENLRWVTRSTNNYNRRHLQIANGRAVYCVELDRVFNSMKEAAEELNIHKASISNCCRGTQKTAGGYHWKYVS